MLEREGGGGVGGPRGRAPHQNVPWAQKTAKLLDSGPISPWHCHASPDHHVGHINDSLTCPMPIACQRLAAVTKIYVAGTTAPRCPMVPFPLLLSQNRCSVAMGTLRDNVEVPF